MISAWDVSGAHLEMVGLKAKCISKREKLIWLAKKRDNKNCEEDGFGGNDFLLYGFLQFKWTIQQVVGTR